MLLLPRRLGRGTCHFFLSSYLTSIFFLQHVLPSIVVHGSPQSRMGCNATSGYEVIQGCLCIGTAGTVVHSIQWFTVLYSPKLIKTRVLPMQRPDRFQQHLCCVCCMTGERK